MPPLGSLELLHLPTKHRPTGHDALSRLAGKGGLRRPVSWTCARLYTRVPPWRLARLSRGSCQLVRSPVCASLLCAALARTAQSPKHRTLRYHQAPSASSPIIRTAMDLIGKSRILTNVQFGAITIICSCLRARFNSIRGAAHIRDFLASKR